MKHYFLLLLFLLAGTAQAQDMTVDLSLIDGVELRPDNIFSYRIQNHSGQVQQALIEGRVQYRQSGLSFSYRYTLNLQPGMNSISRDVIPSPSWTFSSPSLKELFLNYAKLPQGTYEYCVSVTLKKNGSVEYPDPSDPQACVYQTVEDLFLIHLVTPENDAKIYEYNPMLAWVVNYPFASELSYKLRVAELKQGQTPQSAITRNNAMYRDDHVMTTGTVYPVTARPLQKWQPYVWTVDAYYKGILLGGAEVWKFTIIDDSELVAVPKEQSYYEFEKHQGDTRLYAVGELKLKYVSELNADTLHLQIIEDGNGHEVGMQQRTIPLALGDNRLVLGIYEQINLKHKGKYTLTLRRVNGSIYKVPFTYINPTLIQE